MPDPWQRVRAVVSALPEMPLAVQAARMLRSRGTIPVDSPDFGDAGAVVIGAWSAGAPVRALELYRRQRGALASGSELAVAAAMIGEIPSDLRATVAAITGTDGSRLVQVLSGTHEDRKLFQALRLLSAAKIRVEHALVEFPV